MWSVLSIDPTQQLWPQDKIGMPTCFYVSVPWLHLRSISSHARHFILNYCTIARAARGRAKGTC